MRHDDSIHKQRPMRPTMGQACAIWAKQMSSSQCGGTSGKHHYMSWPADAQDAVWLMATFPLVQCAVECSGPCSAGFHSWMNISVIVQQGFMPEQTFQSLYSRVFT